MVDGGAYEQTRSVRSLLLAWLVVGFLALGVFGAYTSSADDPGDDATPAPSADPDPQPSAVPDPPPSPEAGDTPSVSPTETQTGPSENVVPSPESETSVLGETLAVSGTDMTGLTVLGVSLIVLGAVSYGLAFRAAKPR